MKIRNLVLVALFTALTAVGAFIKIPMPVSAISLQTMFSVLAGMLLGPWLGALSQALYVAMGLIGLPIFTAGGGPGYIFQPSFGYLIGLIPAAIMSGLIIRKAKELKFHTVLLASLCIFAVYVTGLPYLYLMRNLYLQNAISMDAALLYGFLVFIPGDLLKCAVAAFLVAKLRPVLINARLIEVR